ncbi:MAG TPA: hypothetical protein VL551_28085 [Actinospica sp.]|jgi:hypothetical protein|nr:hypothetical protein [Actinospica sp.]
MRTRIRLAAAAAVAAASLAVALPAGASGAAAVRPCTMNDVSFYFGGYSYGLGQRTFDLTLLAHDGITCSLSDTPLIKLAGPPSQKKKIPVSIDGRGGTLILRPNSPLHARFYYSIPDAPDHTVYVTTLTLSMPDKTSRATDFLYPGNTAVYSGGIHISSWTTGIGLGEGEQSF